RVLHAPGVAEPYQAGCFVHAEVPPTIPAFRLADGADHGGEAGRRGVRFGQLARYRVLQRQQLFLAFGGADAPADAAITLELAIGVKNRFTGNRDPARAAVFGEPAQLEVVKRLVRLDYRAVRRPVLLGHIGSGKLPSPLADVGEGAQSRL